MLAIGEVLVRREQIGHAAQLASAHGVGMEAAKSADPKKVGAALHAPDGSESASRFFPGGKVRFDAQGRWVGAELVILRWQNGEPKPVYPQALAVTPAAWPRH